MKQVMKLLVCATFALTCLVGYGQEPVADQSASTSGASPASRDDTPEYQTFSGEMVKYKDALKKLRALKDSYQTASAEDRDKIVAEFTPLVEETKRMQDALVPLALKAYESVDGENDELRAFLCSMLHWLTEVRENYEVAYDIAKVIFDYPLPENGERLYAYAAFAAFCTMNLEDAQAWTKQADELKAFAQVDQNKKMRLEENLKYVMPEYVDLWAKEQAIREKEAAADNLPRVLLKTTKGDITVELFANEAPIATNNFLELVKKGFYTDVPFHRVLPYFMAQGGDPTGSGSGGPGYCIKCECHQPNYRHHFRGSLSMAHAGLNTGGSQFFLTFVPTSFLDGRHTVFGRVIDGVSVLSDIQRIDPEQESEAAPDKILEAKIIRGEPGPFEKLPPR